MTKRTHARLPAAEPSSRSAYRERAARLRDAAGRFARKPEPVQEPPPPETFDVVPAPADSHPDTYALRIDEGGLGLHAAPGASVIVEPVMPEKAGLAVLYPKGGSGPVIFDLTHHFDPRDATPLAPGSEVVPMVSLCEPITGVHRWLRADRIDRLHRVTGIYTPVEIAETHRPAPTPLPLMTEYPEGMGEQYNEDAGSYPLVRPGETVIYDPAERGPKHGALCVLQWRSGQRSILLTNLRRLGGMSQPMWFVDPVNRPPSREMMERRLSDNRPGDMLYTSDGPFTTEHLREKIVGTVVAVLVPKRAGAVIAKNAAPLRRLGSEA